MVVLWKNLPLGSGIMPYHPMYWGISNRNNIPSLLSILAKRSNTVTPRCVRASSLSITMLVRYYLSEVTLVVVNISTSCNMK